MLSVRDNGVWEDRVIYVLGAVADTSSHTPWLAERIRKLMFDYNKHRMRDKYPRIYSQDLLNNLFRHAYTRIDVLQQDLRVSRPTAARYLHIFAREGFVAELRVGGSSYYVIAPLVDLFLQAEGGPMRNSLVTPTLRSQSVRNAW